MCQPGLGSGGFSCAAKGVNNFENPKSKTAQLCLESTMPLPNCLRFRSGHLCERQFRLEGSEVAGEPALPFRGRLVVGVNAKPALRERRQPHVVSGIKFGRVRTTMKVLFQARVENGQIIRRIPAADL